MLSLVFAPAIPAIDTSQNFALERTTTGFTTDLLLENSMGCKNNAKLGGGVKSQ